MPKHITLQGTWMFCCFLKCSLQQSTGWCPISHITYKSHAYNLQDIPMIAQVITWRSLPEVNGSMYLYSTGLGPKAAFLWEPLCPKYRPYSYPKTSTPNPNPILYNYMDPLGQGRTLNLQRSWCRPGKVQVSSFLGFRLRAQG